MAAAARVGVPPVPPREESDAGAGRDKLDPITCSSRWLFVNFSVEIDHVTEMLVLRSSCLQVTSIQACLQTGSIFWICCKVIFFEMNLMTVIN